MSVCIAAVCPPQWLSCCPAPAQFGPRCMWCRQSATVYSIVVGGLACNSEWRAGPGQVPCSRSPTLSLSLSLSHPRRLTVGTNIGWRPMWNALDMHRIAAAIEQRLRLLAIIAAVRGWCTIRNGLHNHMTIIRQRALDTDARRWIVKAKWLQVDAIQHRILGYGAHIECGEAQVLQLIPVACAELPQCIQCLLHALFHARGVT